MRPLIEPPTTEPTPELAAVIQRVHELAAEYATLPEADKLPYLVTVVRVQSSGRERFKTVQHTAADSPRFRPLMAMIDALVATEQSSEGRTYATKHGVFTDADIRDAEAMTTRDEVLFPVRYPWAVAPVVDEKTRHVITPGTRGPAVFRRRDDGDD